MSNSGYAIYNVEQKKRIKHNTLDDFYPLLPNKKYDIIYADPPWDYGGKMQFDKSSKKDINIDFKKNVFISSASFKYPTVKLAELKKIDLSKISAPDCLLFMWTTGPQLANAIELGESWGFEFKTIAFIWDKMAHNPGQYTLSQTEQCLVFKKGRIPNPRGIRNAKQFFQSPRSKHSEKPEYVIDNITKMFPQQKKIELFARRTYPGWDAWGLEAPQSESLFVSNTDTPACKLIQYWQ